MLFDMKRILSIVLVIGGIILLWVFLGADPVERLERRLRLKGVERVDAIVLFDAYDTVRLEKQKDSWYLWGSEPVAAVAIENLLYAAQNLQVDAYLEDAVADRAVGTRVVFSKGGKNLLAYWLGAEKGGLIIRPEHGSDLYRVSLPGYTGVKLETVFSSAPNHYREHMLIHLLPSDIHRLEVELRSREAYCFLMDRSGVLSLELPAESDLSPAGVLDELSVRRLFSYFTAIRYEDLLEPDPSLTPDSEFWMGSLKLETFTGESHRLEVYSLEDEAGGGSHMFLARVLYNDAPGVLVVKYLYLDVLLRDLSRFFTVVG